MWTKNYLCWQFEFCICAKRNRAYVCYFQYMVLADITFLMNIGSGIDSCVCVRVGHFGRRHVDCKMKNNKYDDERSGCRYVSTHTIALLNVTLWKHMRTYHHSNKRCSSIYIFYCLNSYCVKQIYNGQSVNQSVCENFNAEFYSYWLVQQAIELMQNPLWSFKVRLFVRYKFKSHDSVEK